MPTIQHAKLRAMIRDIVAAGGSGGDEAAIVADHLVEANLMGHDSHGVGMVPRYVKNLQAGLLVANEHAEVIKDLGAIAVVDGRAGYGQVVAREATELAIARARAHGLALVALRNAHHIGRVGACGEMCAAAGLVSMHYVNVTGHMPIVAPFRGSDARFTTNPYCCAFPATATRPAFLLDMATSRIAMGKVRVAMNKGETVEPETLIDPDGRPTTDPAVMFREPIGSLLTVGRHKGYGLALVCELLAGVLTGGGTSQPAWPRTGSIINNMLTIVFDPALLIDEAARRLEADAILDYVTASPPADPDAPVLVPGEPERLSRAERERDGIPVDDATWAEIVAAGCALGLARSALEGAAE